MIAAIQSYEERIAYIYEHKPLMNLNIGLTSSFAEQRPELCQSIYKVMTNNTVVLDFLDNTNLSVGNKGREKEQLQEIQQAAKGLYLVSGCLL